jgi:hypothetical protein
LKQQSGGVISTIVRSVGNHRLIFLPRPELWQVDNKMHTLSVKDPGPRWNICWGTSGFATLRRALLCNEKVRPAADEAARNNEKQIAS